MQCIYRCRLSPETNESRTVRISNETYKKLAMQAGYWSIIFGETQSVSELADSILDDHCTKAISVLEKLISNKEAVEKFRKNAKDEMNRIDEMFKLMKIKE